MSASAGKNSPDKPGTPPPLSFAIRAPCPPKRAFQYFTRDIHKWWPLQEFSVAQADARVVTMEPAVGGRIYETDKDGTERLWGTIKEWVPPHRLAFSWHPGRNASQAMWIVVTFTPEREHTLVELTHGGWEALGEEAERTRGNYRRGWGTVLEESFHRFTREQERSRP